MNRTVLCGLACAALLVSASCATAASPEYAVKTEPKEKVSFLDRLKRDVPPLKNPRGKRWPMICWECVSFDPQGADVYRALLERGLTQHIQMNEKMIPTAKAIQDAGSPVIMMQGGGGPWPYDQAENWAHQFDADYQAPKPGDWWESCRACPAVFDGWRVNADRLRVTLRKFKEAGVTVDAVWMDWEGEPLSAQGKEAWENARHCKRCRQTIPAAVIRDSALWKPYCRRLYLELTGSYLAAPARDVFPACSVTNWMVVYSTAERPVLGWSNGKVPPSAPMMFTATNPVAYGDTVFWQFWKADWPLDRLHVDRFYTHLLLREVSDDAANKRQFGADKDCFPWVSRWCPDDEDPKIPLISRPAYREALRHIWLRGADSMQIFQPTRAGYEDIVFAEAADAVAVYDEMLAYARFLDEGEPMCLDVPDLQFDGVLWSGLRLPTEAVVRVIHQSEGSAKVTIEAWPGKTVELEADENGRTYLLRLADGQVKVQH